MTFEYVPAGDEADRRWADLGFRRRCALLFWGDPVDRHEAATVFGFARRIQRRHLLMGLVSGVGTVVVMLALDMLVDGLALDSFVLAGGIGIGVGLGMGAGGAPARTQPGAASRSVPAVVRLTGLVRRR